MSAAPYGDCSNDPSPPTPTANLPAPGAKNPDDEFYCPGAVHLGDTVTVYANGRGQGNDWGHDASFKGYIGGSSYYAGATGLNQESSQKTGGGNNGPSSCPAYMAVPIISGIYHNGAAEFFVPIGTVVIKTTSCGNPTTGTVAYTISDPYHIVVP
jgi:hypothetical protein